MILKRALQMAAGQSIPFPRPILRSRLAMPLAPACFPTMGQRWGRRALGLRQLKADAALRFDPLHIAKEGLRSPLPLTSRAVVKGQRGVGLYLGTGGRRCLLEPRSINTRSPNPQRPRYLARSKPFGFKPCDLGLRDRCLPSAISAFRLSLRYAFSL